MIKKIGVLTSGGDAPGMNACLRAIVRSGLVQGLEIYAIKDGYRGLIDDDIEKMTRHSVSEVELASVLLVSLNLKIPMYKKRVLKF